MNDDTLSVEVADSLAGERVDRASPCCCEVSRSIANELIESGAVSIDGRTVTKPSVRLEIGQVLRVPGSVAHRSWSRIRRSFSIRCTWTTM